MTLDKIIESLISAVPEMIAMLLVVRLFISAQKDERAAFKDTLKEQATACHVFQQEVVKDTTTALSQNSKALERNTEALGRASDYLRVIRHNGQ